MQFLLYRSLKVDEAVSVLLERTVTIHIDLRNHPILEVDKTKTEAGLDIALGCVLGSSIVALDKDAFNQKGKDCINKGGIQKVLILS